MNIKKLIILGIAFPIFLVRAIAEEPPQAKKFFDVPINHPAYASVQYLSNEGIFKGYKNGEFGIDKPLSRDAALKIILIAADKKIPASVKKQDFSDVPTDAWYAPYVKAALEAKIISHQTDTFSPARTVNRAEFIKMLLAASGIDFEKYNLSGIEISDVPAGVWYEPYMKFAVKANILEKDENGKVYPGETLTRKHAAQILYLSLAKSPQLLLDLTEINLLETVLALESGDMERASFAVLAAENFSQQALKHLPENKIVISASKITEALKNLTGAYIAGKNGRLDDVITAAKNAWSLADEAQKANPQQKDLVIQIKTLASSLADKARTKKADLLAQEGTSK